MPPRRWWRRWNCWARASTVPFIARYRKEKTGGLDDTQLRKLEERLSYLRELEDRRASVLKAIDDQGKLTPDLARAINGAATKVELEDLYAPYKVKRRTKAQIAREAGLEPLSDALLKNPALDPEAEAAKFIDAGKGVADAKAALDGARHILVERIAETPTLVGGLREWLWSDGELKSAVKKGKGEEGAKFSDYFDFGQRIKDMPSHRALAMLRGMNEGILSLDLDVAHESGKPHPAEGRIKSAFGIADRGRPADAWLGETVRLAWRDKLSGTLETGLLSRLKERADAEAIGVFSRNLKDLLLAAPAGHRVTMGLDPGIRTGVKVAVVDQTGKVVATTTIYPHEPRRDWQGSLAALAALCIKHKVDIVSVGNGTGGRETDKLVAELMTKMPELKLTKAMVSEAGASVYSASELAAKEFPDLDVSLRGAVSIARRLQDPLAELVKIEPKAIGVGQYQHDVDQIGSRPLARCGGRGLRQLGRRRRQHGVGPAAGARLRSQPDARLQHRRLPRRERRLQSAHQLEEGAAPRRQGLRAGGGLPAHHGRQEPARCFRRAPRGLRGGGEDLRGDQATAEVDHRRPRVLEVAAPRRLSPTPRSASRPSPTSSPSWKSRAAIHARNSRRPPSRRASTRSAT